jgi:xylan 1,4-beta-xylosidase
MKETFVFSVKKDTRRVEVSNHWKYCVGSGQAKLAMRSDYARQLKFIHDELGIERVRFRGIFDDDMQANYVHGGYDADAGRRKVSKL